MSHFTRYHIRITKSGQDKRTTISLDKIASDLLAVALDKEPESREAHTAVREWLDNSLSEWVAFDPLLPVSQQATYLAIQRIADPALLAKLHGYPAA